MERRGKEIEEKKYIVWWRETDRVGWERWQPQAFYLCVVSVCLNTLERQNDIESTEERDGRKGSDRKLDSGEYDGKAG